ncbi:MAG: dTDP-4-dehydrorhamnose reductase, partial [Flavisolibacter sp.]
MPSRSKIIVTGSNGQLGNELKDLAPSYQQFEFIFLDSSQAPIHNKEIIKNIFKQYKPDYLINCAAYTAVDKAEEEKEMAMEINGNAVGELAYMCKQYNSRFIHISTDYVFDGASSTPLNETDPVHPVNYYGETKLEGEKQAIANNKDGIIIRTSWVYSYYGKNFVKTMIRLMKEKETINVVNDQLGSPTYAADLAQVILNIISSDKWIPVIYHFSNEGIISWFDFATEIRNKIGSSCKIIPIHTSQFPTPAKRPHYSGLDKTRIRNT